MLYYYLSALKIHIYLNSQGDLILQVHNYQVLGFSRSKMTGNLLSSIRNVRFLTRPQFVKQQNVTVQTKVVDLLSKQTFNLFGEKQKIMETALAQRATG